MLVPNQDRGFPENPSQTMSRPGYQDAPNTPWQPAPPPTIAPIAQSEPPLGYSEIGKYKKRIKSDMIE